MESTFLYLYHLYHSNSASQGVNPRVIASSTPRPNRWAFTSKKRCRKHFSTDLWLPSNRFKFVINLFGNHPRVAQTRDSPSTPHSDGIVFANRCSKMGWNAFTAGQKLLICHEAALKRKPSTSYFTVAIAARRTSLIVGKLPRSTKFEDDWSGHSEAPPWLGRHLKMILLNQTTV